MKRGTYTSPKRPQKLKHQYNMFGRLVKRKNLKPLYTHNKRSLNLGPKPQNLPYITNPKLLHSQCFSLPPTSFTHDVNGEAIQTFPDQATAHPRCILNLKRFPDREEAPKPTGFKICQKSKNPMLTQEKAFESSSHMFTINELWCLIAPGEPTAIYVGVPRAHHHGPRGFGSSAKTLQGPFLLQFLQLL